MKVTVNFLSTEVRLRDEISLEPASLALKEVIKALEEQGKALLGRFIKEDLSPAEGSAILVNGRNIRSLNGLETKIQDGDEMTFTVLVAGG
jgi:molybdopterin synthase sulfur carrier subunit